MAITVTDKNFSHIIFDSEKPVLLNFSNRQSDASRKQDNLLRLFAHEHPDVIIGRVDTGKEPSLAAMYGIQTVPSKTVNVLPLLPDCRKSRSLLGSYQNKLSLSDNAGPLAPGTAILSS
mgnify:CR=1 FL=1